MAYNVPGEGREPGGGGGGGGQTPTPPAPPPPPPAPPPPPPGPTFGNPPFNPNHGTRITPQEPPWFDPGDTGDPSSGSDPNSGIAPRPTRRPEAVKRTLTVGATDQILPIIYGRAQVGALAPYGFARGSDVWLKLKLCEGPIQGVESMGFGDSQDTSFAGLGLVEGVDYNIYLGTPDQGVDPILAASQGPDVWRWADPGTAYIALRYNVLRTGFDAITPESFRCVVLGRLVNDPRTDDFTADHDTLFAARAYSENPALALLDFIRSRRFGMGLDVAQIDLDSFSEAADDCDEVIASLGGATNPDGAPTPTILTSATGQIENGTYRWAVTWKDTAGVESLASPVSSELTISASTPSRAVKLVPTGTAPPSEIATLLLYRQKKGPGGVWGPLKRVPNGTIPKTAPWIPDIHPTSRLGGQPPLESNVAKFKIATRIDEDQTIGDTIRSLRSIFTAVLVYNDGKYQCYLDKSRTATDITYDASNTIGIPTLRGADPSDAPSQVVVHFINSDLNYKPDQAVWPRQPAIATGAFRSDRTIAHYTIDTPHYYSALIIAKQLYARLSAEFSVEWGTHHSGARPLPMSIVTGSWTRAGISSRSIVLSSVGMENRNAWRLRGELGITYDYSFVSDPGHDPITVDPPPPGSPPAPSDGYVLQIGLSISHNAPLPG